MALSRVTALEGLHLINFNPKNIIVNKAALIEYARLGSKSIPAPENPAAKPPIAYKSGTPPERVWYISNARKIARSTFETAADESKDKEPNNKPPGKPRGRPRGNQKPQTGDKDSKKKRGRHRARS